MRLHLQPGERLLPDLCDLARAAVQSAPRVIGPLLIEGVHALDPIWRPLINDLREVIQVEWDAPAFCETSWFNGSPRCAATKTGKSRAVSCADPYHEALEAMRWARKLLAAGRARASDIALATTAPAAWDDYILALGSASDLPLCFVHGRPALATRDGQRCAALADALQSGLSQARMRRLLSLVANQGTILDDLPDRSLPVSSEASLSTAADWERALTPFPETASILVPIMKLLESGPDCAEEAAKLLLRGRSRRLWDEALRSAPASALMFSLETLRVADDRDPGDSVVWCSADQLAAAPRRFSWLLGLTAGGWPRTRGLDPILPDYIVASTLLDPDPIEAADRRCLENILAFAEEAVLSSGRLTNEGKRAGLSALIPEVEEIEVYHRERQAGHALTEADRLLARPQDRSADPIVSSAMAAWHSWGLRSLTPHDGLVAMEHPLLSALLLSAAAKEHYDRCAKLFTDSIGAIADTLLASFFGETDEVIAAFDNFKRNAAVLDFDDILIRTRELLRARAKVREEVAARYRHILVDEYQDTDPIQSEILFPISSEPGSSESWGGHSLRPGALFMVGDPKQAIYRFRRADLKSYLRARSAIEAQFLGNVLPISANFRSGKSILEHVDRVFAERLARQQGGYAALHAQRQGADQPVREVERQGSRLPHLRRSDRVWRGLEEEISRRPRISLGQAGRSYASFFPSRPAFISRTCSGASTRLLPVP